MNSVKQNYELHETNPRELRFRMVLNGCEVDSLRGLKESNLRGIEKRYSSVTLLKEGLKDRYYCVVVTGFSNLTFLGGTN